LSDSDPELTSARAHKSPEGQRERSTIRRHAIPEFVEISIVEERDCFDDFCVPHLKVPSVRIAIRLAVPNRGFGIEQDDDHIAISEDATESWNQWLRHARIKRINHLVDELLLAVIGLGQGR